MACVDEVVGKPVLELKDVEVACVLVDAEVVISLDWLWDDATLVELVSAEEDWIDKDVTDVIADVIWVEEDSTEVVI